MSAGNLRTQCKATVKKYDSVSTCGVPASKGDAPCITTSAAGKVTCAIKASTKCSGAACATFSTCIDAADTNGDGIVGKGDSGACVVAPTPTPTPAPTPCTGRFCDNGDGTITDNQAGLMWEKKDRAGGLDDERQAYLWAGQCPNGGYCQPDAAAASTCSTATGGAVGCAQCGGTATCNTIGTTTIWHWLNQLNAANFAGHSDWQIPTVGQDAGTAQLETIVDTSVAGCGSGSLCVPPAFNTGCTPGCTVTTCSCTTSESYWSATTYAALPIYAWDVNFSNGFVNFYGKSNVNYVRAVR